MLKQAPLFWHEFLYDPELKSKCNEFWERNVELGDANALSLLETLQEKNDDM